MWELMTPVAGLLGEEGCPIRVRSVVMDAVCSLTLCSENIQDRSLKRCQIRFVGSQVRRDYYTP